MRHRTPAERWVPWAGLALLGVMPLFVGEYPVLLLTKIAALAIFAMSLDLLVGVAGLVSFGHAAFLGAGAYAAAMLAPEFAPAELLLTLPAAVAAGGLLALVIGALALRASGVYFIMATLAFAQMTYYAVHDSAAFGGSDGMLIFAKPQLGGVYEFSGPVPYFYFVLVFLVAVYALLVRIERSAFGQVLRGIRMDEKRMAALGYAPYPYKLAAFVIAGALAGLAGWLLAYQAEYVSPALLDWRESGLVLMMVILGGVGSLFGPAFGAFALVLLQEALSEVTEHWMLGLGLVVIAAVLVLPRGLAGLLRGRRP